MARIQTICHYAWLIAVFAVLTLLSACEDDPILLPNDGNNQGGSYGRIDIALPDDSSASKPAFRDVKADQENNPALF